MMGTGRSAAAFSLSAVALLLLSGLVPAVGALDFSTKAMKVVASSPYKDSNIQSYDHPGVGELDGRGGAIAVLDTGVDNDHPTFKNAFVAGARYDDSCQCMKEREVTDDPVDPDDSNGHGTHVASIALGRGGDGGPRGVAPGAELVDIKIADSLGSSNGDRIAKGIQWAINYNKGNTKYPANDPIRVIVVSFGSLEPWTDRSYNNAMQKIQDAYNLPQDVGPILTVAAAGNCGPGSGDASLSCPSGGSDEDTIASPGATPEALTVGAVELNRTADNERTIHRGDDEVAGYSSRGPNPGRNASDTKWRKPDVVAPGSNITAACHATAGTPTSMDCTKNGTSMAAPHVAGLAAVLWQALERHERSDPSPQVVKDLIIEGASDLGPEGWDKASGYGYVDGYRSMVQGTNAPPVSEFGIVPENPEVGEQVEFRSTSYDPPNTDGSDRIEKLIWTIDGETTEMPADQPTLRQTYDQTGTHEVSLVAVDERGSPSDPYNRTFNVSEPKADGEDPNDPPKVVVRHGPDPIYAGEEAWFDAGNSTDPDGDELTSFAWDFDAGSDFAADKITEKPFVTYTFDEPGPYPVQVRVTDETGRSSKTTLEVQVEPERPGDPDVELTNPQNGDVIQPGQVNVTWTVRDNPADTFGVSIDTVAVDDTDRRYLVVNMTEGSHTIAVKATGPGGSDVDRVNVTVQEPEPIEQSGGAEASDDGGQTTADDGHDHDHEHDGTAHPSSDTSQASGEEGAEAGPTSEDGSDATEDGSASNDTPGPGLALALAVTAAAALGHAQARRP